MKNTVKKCIAAVVAAFILALLMEVAIQHTNPPLFQYQFDGQVQNEFSLGDTELRDYTVEGNLITPTSGDPQILVRFADQTQASGVASVRLRFDVPLNDWGYIQFYFPDKDGLYSQSGSKTEYVQQGATELIADIPHLQYPELRIDINQSVALNSIQFSDSPATRLIQPEVWNFARMFGIFAVLAIIIFLLLYFNVFIKMKNFFCSIGRAIAKDPKRSCKLLGIAAAIIIILCFILYALLCATHKTPHPVYFAAVAVFGFVISIFVIFFRHSGKKPEFFFLAVFLAAAFLIAVFVPTSQALVVWDDETHYAKILNLSYFGEDTRMTAADSAFITRVYSSEFNLDNQAVVDQALDDMFHKGASYTDSTPKLSFEKLAYLPGAIGLFLGRMFNFSFHNILVLGRIASLVLFALLCFLGIRKLKTGKMILIVLALLPTNVFLASNFSYDTWVTGFTILGLAWFFSEVQQPNKILSIRDWIIMLVAMAVGMAPKAIYFPLILLLFFMPKSKFTSRRTLLIYRLSVIATTLFVLATFLMPMLINGAGVGDTRGGSDVNSSGQIAYILNNPFEFGKMMIKYIPTYLSMGNAQNYVTSFAYLGDGYFYGILIVLLWLVSFTDRNEYDRFTTTVSHKIRTLLIALITVVCVASALYIAFTPVGFDTVNGCQARYLMPVIFPVLYVIGSHRIVNNINRNVYNTAVFTISGLILFFNIAYMVFGRYWLHNS